MSDLTEHRMARRKKEVACAKCGHSNEGGTNQCAQCGSRLYISCHNCGHSSERTASKCGHCGQRLHRPPWQRIKKRLFGTSPKITPVQIVLLVISVYIAYRVIVYLAEYQPPSYEGG